LVLGWFTRRLRQVVRADVAARHNNSNAADRPKCFLLRFKFSAAADLNRYVASAIARWSARRASRFSASLVVGGATRALGSVKVRGDRRRSYTT